jgi:hypothetical protein
MKIIATRKSEQNDAAIDPWTVVHFGVGLAFGLWGMPFLWSMFAAGAYEIFEQALERSEVGQTIFTTSGPENIPNVIVDLGVFALGHQLGRAWNDS